MSDFSDAIVRAAGASAVGGTVGASIGGSVTAVFGPAAAGGCWGPDRVRRRFCLFPVFGLLRRILIRRSDRRFRYQVF